MGGNQTAGFDLVIQLAEEAYQDLLGVFFDTSGLIGQIADLIPGVEADMFNLSVSLDRPTDVTLQPPDGENPLDVRLDLGESGAAASLRIVVGMRVDRSAPDRDVVSIDFANSIYYAGVTVGGVQLPLPNLRENLQELIPSIPILPVPVDRSSTDPTEITRADFRIIDDPSSTDRDVTSGMLTFGGGSPGNAAGLTSFVSPSGRGAIAIFFQWLCRMAVPRLEEELGLDPGSFTITRNRCSLNRTVRVDEDEDVDLTSLVIRLDDDAIRIDAHVTKSGFCYDASGDVTAWLRIGIRDGRLQASAEIGDPDVDVDIPWYCWLAAAVIGAVLGGILIGVIGAIVGAVLVPLIVWLATEVIEGTIDQVADEIVDAINGSVPDIDVPAFGVNILFQDVFIDDVVLKANLVVTDNSPVRAQGTVRLYPGQGMDLDTGERGGADAAPADVLWMGSGYTRRLETGCQAGLAHTGSRDLDNMPKYRLYGYDYQTDNSVSIWQLGTFNPFGIFFGDEWEETRLVLAVRTNEGRYSIVQVTEIDDDWIRLRYKTFETAQSSVQIFGNFRCIRFAEPPKDTVAWFEPAIRLSAGAEISAGPRPKAAPGRLESLSDLEAAGTGRAAKGVQNVNFLGGAKIRIAAERMKEKKSVSQCQSSTPWAGERAAMVVAMQAQAYPLGPFYDGRWVAEVEVSQDAHAHLRAVAVGVQGEAKFIWSVGGEVLQDGTSGEIEVYGTAVGYTVNGARLILSVKSDAVIELFVEVTVVDERGCSAASARCITHNGTCIVLGRAIASWKEFRALQAVPPAMVASGLVSTANLSKIAMARSV